MNTLENVLLRKEILDGLRPINPEQEKRIIQEFRRDWNFHCSHIEEIFPPYGETKALILHNITIRNKATKDYFDPKGHDDAIEEMVQVVKSNQPLTEEFILRIHKLLLKKPYVHASPTYGEGTRYKHIEIGVYKSTPNHAIKEDGSKVNFATPAETPDRVRALLQWFNELKDAGTYNPVRLAAEFFFKYLDIHPFDDGNGRTGRILLNLILMQSGFPPVVIKINDRKNYFESINLSNKLGTLDPFIEYIASLCIISLDIMISVASVKIERNLE